MLKQSILLPRLLAGLLLSASTLCASAASMSYTMNFDSLSSGADPGSDPTATALGVTFGSGFLTPDLDANGDPIVDINGDPIPGFTHWEAYPGVSLAVGNPSAAGFGPAPSPNNAIDGRYDIILVQLAHPTLLNGFSTAMAIGTGFGSPFDVHLSFLDANGKTLFNSADYLQNATTGIGLGFGPTLVSEILLPGNVFYDNVTLSVVPAPATIWLIGAGLLALIRSASRKA